MYTNTRLWRNIVNVLFAFVRFATLALQDEAILKKRGFKAAAFGAVSCGSNGTSTSYVPGWLKVFAADVLRYIDYERKALPVSLICDSRERQEKQKLPSSPRRGKESQIVYQEGGEELPYDVADSEGRNAMERRTIDFTQTLSLVGRVLARHRKIMEETTKGEDAPIEPPLRILSHKEVVQKLWTNAYPNPSLYNSLIRSLINCGTPPSEVEFIKSTANSFPTLNDADLNDPVKAANARHEVKIALMAVRNNLLKLQKNCVAECAFNRDRHVAAADLLLLYAHTDNFVVSRGYSSFESSPTVVYARELGGRVPRSKLKEANERGEGKIKIIDAATKVPKKRKDDEAGFIIGPFPPHEKVAYAALNNVKEKEEGCVIHFSNLDLFVDTKLKAAKGADLLRVFLFFSGPEDNAPLVAKNQVFNGQQNYYTREQCEEFWAQPCHQHLKRLRKIKTTGKPSSSKLSARKNAKHDPKLTTDDKNDIKQVLRDFLNPESEEDRDDPICDGEEPVATYTKMYKPDYIASQLLSWHKGGVDVADGLPVEELTGCVSLPMFDKVYAVPNEISPANMKRHRAAVKQYEGEVKNWEKGKALWEEADNKRRKEWHAEKKRYDKWLKAQQASQQQAVQAATAVAPMQLDAVNPAAPVGVAIHDMKKEEEERQVPAQPTSEVQSLPQQDGSKKGEGHYRLEPVPNSQTVYQTIKQRDGSTTYLPVLMMQNVWYPGKPPAPASGGRQQATSVLESTTNAPATSGPAGAVQTFAPHPNAAAPAAQPQPSAVVSALPPHPNAIGLAPPPSCPEGPAPNPSPYPARKPVMPEIVAKPPTDAFTYSHKHKVALWEWGNGKHERSLSWNKDLLSVFGNASNDSLLGSPVLDFLLTSDDTNLHSALYILKPKRSGVNHSEGEAKSDMKELMESTLSSALPTASNFNWVQCEEPSCMKWRKLPWYVDMNELPDFFTCKDNKWEASKASCDAEEDKWDALAERTVLNEDTMVKREDLAVGAKFDAFCTARSEYKEVTVEKVEAARALVVFHTVRPETREERDVGSVKEWKETDEEGMKKFAPLHFYTKKNDGQEIFMSVNLDEGKKDEKKEEVEVEMEEGKKPNLIVETAEKENEKGLAMEEAMEVI